jgi:hypothetical protein
MFEKVSLPNPSLRITFRQEYHKAFKAIEIFAALFSEELIDIKSGKDKN